MEVCLLVLQLDNPRELERAYREQPEKFKQLHAEAYATSPDSLVLQIWNERLHYEEIGHGENKFEMRSWVGVLVLAVLAAITSRVMLYFVMNYDVQPFNMVFGVLPFLAAYFLYTKRASRKSILVVSGAFLTMGLLTNVLPQDNPDLKLLMVLHFAVVSWMILGLAFTGDMWRQRDARVAYLRWTADFIVLYGLMAICGGIVTGITMGLFEAIELSIETFYFDNVVIVGVASLAMVATALILRTPRLVANLIPLLAKLFSPVLLVLLTTYLIYVISFMSNLVDNRNFLMMFNVVLLLVLALMTVAITNRPSTQRADQSASTLTLYDGVLISLVSVTLLIDTIALAIIGYRIFDEYGFTPNRIAVLGLNVLIFVHLGGVLNTYLRLYAKRVPAHSLASSITRYLPIYGAWAAFVAIGFPLLFA